jgi:hypothetical protein
MVKKNASRIVEAVGAAVGKKTPRGAEIEAAMSDAVKQAQAEGVTDPAEIRARMLAAADRVKAGG